MAAAAGLATLDIYEREGLLTRAGELTSYWEEVMHRLRDAPYVKDIRNIGLIVGVELESRKGAPGARAYDVLNAAYKAGAMIRVTGDIIALAPPLIVEKKHIDTLADLLREALLQTA